MSLNEDTAPLRSSGRANTSLLSVNRTPQSQGEEFFTDSLLDASKIPTPSPKKQPFHKAYKERRAIGNSRALKSAWQSSGRSSFSDSDRTKSSVHHQRPTKLPSPSRTPSPLRQIDGTSTPQPEISPTSPSVVSSPAHGLDDTYKRIAEEEAIAEQEGELEDEEEYTDEMHHRNAYAPSFHPDDESPTGDQTLESDSAYDLGRGKENVMVEDGTAPTQASGISFLEDLTDQDLAAKLTPHAVQAAKDRALLEKATQRQTAINFKGNKNGPSLSERLQRRSTTDVDESPHYEEPQRPSSAVDDFREPSANIPKSWARQRTGRDWMQKSRQRREQGRNGTSSPVLDSSQVDWAAAAADVALPSVEDSSTPKATASRNSSPASLHSQSSLDRVRQWELNDFTGQSLQVSDSPPVRPRTNVADQRQQREIERLEKQAVTTSRLGQYRKRDPNDLVKILSRERSPAANAYPTPEHSATPPVSVSHLRPKTIATPSVSVQNLKEVKFADEGEPIPNTPVVVYRSSSSTSSSASNQQTRPDNDRKVSEDHLARLVKAMSHSPKPSSTPEERSMPETTKEAQDADTPGAEGEEIVTHDTLIDRVAEENLEEAKQDENSLQSSKQVVDVETTPKANKEADTAKTPKVTGAWTDTILPDTVLRTIRKQEERPTHAQTPHVRAGGWIETPLPEGERQSSALAPIPIEEEVPVPAGLTNGISKPREDACKDETSASSKQPQREAPKSALTSLLARAKSRLMASDGQTPGESNDTLHLDDSTINSLEDLLTLDNAELTTLIRMGAESEAREQLVRDHLGAEPIADAELLERLGGKLERLRTNIHDARKGISKLEHQVSSEPSSTALSLKRPGTCTTCGSPTYLIAINFPFTISHLCHTRKPGQYLPRLTWLGWLTVLAWLWYFSEQAMADMYSHPLYTDHTYSWPSEPEPIFPLVLPTMLWRWCGRKIISTLFGPVWWLLIAIFRVLGQFLGWTDGFVDDGAISIHGPSIGQVLGSLEDVAGMGGDEFI